MSWKLMVKGRIENWGGVTCHSVMTIVNSTSASNPPPRILFHSAIPCTPTFPNPRRDDRTICHTTDYPIFTSNPLAIPRHPGSLDLLRTLRIESEEDYGEAGLRPNSLSVLRTATRLHSVTLSKIEDIAYLESVGIPWDQLTELHINEASVRPSQYYHILRHCAALVSARIDIYDDDDPARLRKLILTGKVFLSYAGFLHNFALPSLVNLSLPGDDTDDGADPSKSFAAPTFPALQRLVIDDDHQVSQARYESTEIMSWLRA
ncbi:hypothetical protein B0H17DRAFT_1076325, partial [Mycena rosella]